MKSPEYDIVCIARPSWDGPCAKSIVLLMKQLAQQHRVLYVHYASTWKDIFVSFLKIDIKKIFRTLGLMSRIKIIRINRKRLAVLTLPPMLPLNFLPSG